MLISYSTTSFFIEIRALPGFYLTWLMTILFRDVTRTRFTPQWCVYLWKQLYNFYLCGAYHFHPPNLLIFVDCFCYFVKNKNPIVLAYIYSLISVLPLADIFSGKKKNARVCFSIANAFLVLFVYAQKIKVGYFLSIPRRMYLK